MYLKGINCNYKCIFSRNPEIFYQPRNIWEEMIQNLLKSMILCFIFIYIHNIYIFFFLPWLVDSPTTTGTHTKNPFTPQLSGPLEPPPLMAPELPGFWNGNPLTFANGNGAKGKVTIASASEKKNLTRQSRKQVMDKQLGIFADFFWLRQILKHVFFFRFDGWTFFGVHFLPAFFLWLGFKSQYFTRRWSYEIFFHGL